MTRRFGIDTSILVRLATADPEDAYSYCVTQLSELAARGDEVFASNQVIGEAYVAIQHHYGIEKSAVRLALSRTLRSGLVSPLNGRAVISLLQASGGAGVFDRLIADDYFQHGLPVLTLDQRMASIHNSHRL